MAATVCIGGQVDSHGRIGSGVIDKVRTRAAIDRVSPGTTDDGVVAAAAIDGIGIGVTRQDVVIGRTGEVFKAGQRIARRIACRGLQSGERQVYGHACAGIGVGNRIDPRAAIQDIRASATFDDVVACATRQGIDTCAAIDRVIAGTGIDHRTGRGRRQDIVIVGAGDVFEVGKNIAIGIAAGNLGGHKRQVDGYACRGIGIGNGIHACAAIERIGTAETFDHVISIAAADNVDIAIAGQRVIEGRADDIFDAEQRVALRIAAGVDIGGQIDGHSAGRGGIVNRVVACTTIQNIGTAETDQHVVADTAGNAVGIGIAGDAVIEAGADDVLDRDQGIALRVTARVDARCQIDRHTRSRGCVGNRIDARATIQRIGAAEADQRIVACTAGQHVHAGITRQRIRIGRAGDVLESCENIAIGIAAGRLGTGHRQVDGHARGRIRVGDRVDADAAIERIGTAEAFDHVIARTAGNDVGGRAAGQHVGIGGACQVLDGNERVARAIATGCGACVEVCGHARGRKLVIDGIHAGTTVETVGACTCDHHVVTGACRQRAAGTIGDQHVGIVRTDDVLDIDQRIALGVAAETRTGCNRAAGDEAGTVACRGDIDLNGAARSRIVCRVGACTTIERVGTAKTGKLVIARTARKRIGAGVAGQRIGIGRADQIFDIGKAVARRIAAAVHIGREVDGHGSGRARIVDHVGARTAIHRVAANATQDGVIAIAAVENVVAVGPVQRVVAIATVQRIGTGVADHRIVIGRARDVLEAGQDIATGITAGNLGGGKRKVDSDARSRRRIRHRIHTGIAIKTVGANAAFDQVIARIAMDRICTHTAINGIIARTGTDHRTRSNRRKRIVIGRTCDIFEVGNHVAGGIATGCGALVEIDGHCRRRERIVERIGTRATVQHVRTAETRDHVVTGIAGQHVHTIVTGQDVVEGRTGRIFDRRQKITLCVATGGRLESQVDGHTCRGRGIVNGVIAVATADLVATGATGNDVVARTGIDDVIAVTTGQKVIAIATRQRVGARPAGKLVIAETAGQDVIAVIAGQDIVAIATDQGIGIGIPGQHVVLGRAGDVFDCDQRITLRIATGTTAGQQIDRDAQQRSGIIRRVDAGSAVENIAACTADQRVVVCTALQRIIANTARQRIGARIADERIVIGVAGDRIGIDRADDLFDIRQDIALCIAAKIDAGRQVDDDALCGGRIVDRVEIRTAVNRVRACAADDIVVARAAADHVHTRRASQDIIGIRADHVFDIAQHVALRIATACSAGCQVDLYPGCRCDIGNRVDTRAAIDRVATAATDENIIIAAAIEAVGTRTTGDGVVARTTGKRCRGGTRRQRIVEGRTENGFDGNERVALCIAATCKAGAQIDGDARGRGRIADLVDAFAAIENVGASATHQRIVAGAAIKLVIAGITGQRIVEGGPDHHFDGGQPVAGRIATTADTGTQVDGHTRRRTGIVGRISACTAIQRVSALAAGEEIIARAAAQRIVGIIAGQAVVIAGAHEILDGIQDVAFGKAAARRTGLEVDHDGRGRVLVIDGIGTVATVEGIGTAATAHQVITGTTGDHIGAAAADQRIVERRTDHVFDGDQGIALRIATGRNAGCQIDLHRIDRTGIVGGIGTKTTIKHVRAAKTAQNVVAKATGQGVCRGRADQRIVIVRTDQVLDALKTVAFGIPEPAGADGRAEIDGYARAGTGIACRIGACAAIERVCACAADQHVIAVAAIENIIAATAIQRIVAAVADQGFVGAVGTVDRIVEAGAEHGFDRDQLVAVRARAVAQVDRQAGPHVAVVDRVEAGAAVERVSTRIADHRVIAAKAAHDVCIGGAGQRVGIVRADHVLDGNQLVALRIATNACSGEQIDLHTGFRFRIIGRVIAGAAIENVGTHAAGQRVVAGISAQLVVKVRALDAFEIADHVAGRIATRNGVRGNIHMHGGIGLFIRQRVLAKATIQRIMPCTGHDDIVTRPRIDIRARRQAPQNRDRTVGHRIDIVRICLAVHITDAELHRAGCGGRGIVGGAGDVEIELGAEIGMEALGIGHMAFLGKRVLQLDLRDIRVLRINGDHIGATDQIGADNRDARGQTRYAKAGDDPVRFRHGGGEFDHAGRGADARIGGVVGIDQVGAIGADDGIGSALNAEMGVGIGGGGGKRAADGLAIAMRRLGCCRNAEKLHGDFRRRRIVFASAGANLGGIRRLGRRRRCGRILVGTLLGHHELLLSGILAGVVAGLVAGLFFLELVLVRLGLHFHNFDRRLRSGLCLAVAVVLGGFLLVDILDRLFRQHGLVRSNVRGDEVRDTAQKNLRIDGAAVEHEFHAIFVDQTHAIADKHDGAAIRELHHQIDVADFKLRVFRVEVEMHRFGIFRRNDSRLPRLRFVDLENIGCFRSFVHRLGRRHGDILLNVRRHFSE